MKSRTVFGSILTISWPLALSLSVIACGDSSAPDPDAGTGGTGGADAGGVIVDQFPPGYVRASLAPVYQLTPRERYDHFTIGGRAMADSDFTSSGVQVSVADKMAALSEKLNREREEADVDLSPVGDLLARPEDRERAAGIPFRGNPSDVEFLDVGGVKKIYVPLGGDTMTPGNEVAVYDESGAARHIEVGVRPVRIAVDDENDLVFVCNQYSDYISVIDARTDRLMRDPQGKLVEIPTEFYCADIVHGHPNPGSRDFEQGMVLVANEERGTVHRYEFYLIVDPIINARVALEQYCQNGSPCDDGQATAVITGVGKNPRRLLMGQDQRSLYVFNSRGGELARINLATNAVSAKRMLNAPSIDGVQLGPDLFVATTTPYRGLPGRAEEDLITADILTAPLQMEGLDGQQHIVHPGAQLDDTRSYHFEDVRSGIFSITSFLSEAPSGYYTDDNDAEAELAASQKILAGALPQAIVANAAGTRVYVALAGSDLVQELEVLSAGGFRLGPIAGGIFQTSARPFALKLDEMANRLYVVTWGGESLEIFDLTTRELIDGGRIDLGYATPAYPATNMEIGEYLFYNADISNDGRKACASCHVDDLLTDGLSFSIGTTAPTALHKVAPTWNQFATDNYLWNGSLASGNTRSLKLSAQTRTNCELVVFGLVEGMTSSPATRVGDPANRVRGNDALCRPVFANAGDSTPANMAEIQAEIARQQDVADQVIRQETLENIGVALSRNEVARFIDFYTLSELRVPPNQLAFLYDNRLLPMSTRAALERGRALFGELGCASCHNPDQGFQDGRNHGPGNTWLARFVEAYGDDARVLDILEAKTGIRALPAELARALARLGDFAPDEEVSRFQPIDFLIPFCPDAQNNHCLRFEDPLAAAGDEAAETARLALLTEWNLADPDRGFVPGNIIGQHAVNTPSLRGLWWQPSYLRHGQARSYAEAILPPGHPLLDEGERGYAASRDPESPFDVHGVTSSLSPSDYRVFAFYLESIE